MRGFNPIRADDLALFSAVLAGQHAIGGFRNRDIRQPLLGDPSPGPDQRRRQSASISRRIRLLRSHGLVAKIPRSRRYRPTREGIALMAAAIYISRQELPELVQRLAS